MKRVAVITCASHPGQLEGRLKYAEYKTLEELQQLVGGGYVTLVPHKKGMDAEWMAYANEEGMIKDMPQNDLAAHVLYQLGFLLCPPTYTYYGPIVIMKQGEKSLTKKQRAMLEETVAKVIAELNEEEEEEEEKDSKKVKTE